MDNVGKEPNMNLPEMPQIVDGESVGLNLKTAHGLASNVEIDERTFRERLHDVKEATKEDLRQSSPLGKIALVGAVSGQVWERLRLAEIITAPIAVNVLQESGSPVLTGLTVLGLVGAQQAIISTSWAETMHTATGTANSINDNFPKMVEYAEDIGPAKKRRWYSHIREGASSFLAYGVTPFVVSEKVYAPETTRAESHKRAAALTGKCALFGFALAAGAAEVTKHVEPETAQTILDWAEKPFLWIGIAAVYEIPRLVKKRWERRQARRAINKETQLPQDKEAEL